MATKRRCHTRKCELVSVLGDVSPIEGFTSPEDLQRDDSKMELVQLLPLAAGGGAYEGNRQRRLSCSDSIGWMCGRADEPAAAGCSGTEMTPSNASLLTSHRGQRSKVI